MYRIADEKNGANAKLLSNLRRHLPDPFVFNLERFISEHFFKQAIAPLIIIVIDRFVGSKWPHVDR